MNYEQASKDQQDNLVVSAEIERRQSAMLCQHAGHIGELLEYLIGYVDGLRPSPAA